jgi:hypothetical protein
MVKKSQNPEKNCRDFLIPKIFVRFFQSNLPLATIRHLFVDYVKWVDETVSHIVCEGEKLAQKEYNRRHNKVAKVVHWNLCKKYGFLSVQPSGMGIDLKK